MSATLTAPVIDTRNKRYDSRLFEAFGFAVSAGQSSLPAETTASVQVPVFERRLLEDLVNWLQRDFAEKVRLLESLILEVATLDPLDKARPINREILLSHVGFERELRRLNKVISTGQALVPSKETMELAIRVANKSPDPRSIAEWVEALGDEVSDKSD